MGVVKLNNPVTMKMMCCYWVFFHIISVGYCRYDVWNDVPCNEVYKPKNCDLDNSVMTTLDDFDRCGPALIPSLQARNFFLAASGRRITYQKNKDEFDRIEIVPKMLRDVSHNSIATTVLGMEVDFPIGISPVAFQKLANPGGELDTVKGISSMKAIMILSSLSMTSLEDIAREVKHKDVHLWMQTYILANHTITANLVRRASRNGYKAIVLTSDSPVLASVTCSERTHLIFPNGTKTMNVPYEEGVKFDSSETFKRIRWLKKLTHLPIVAKGLLSGRDAVLAAKAGASAILVSNQGGRQMDGDPATIEALPGVVKAVKKLSPRIEVFMDGGVRSGSDVYKAIALGAKMVFIGRPVIWGLAYKGAEGVKQVLTMLRNEFNETMLLSGNANIADIKKDTLILPS